MVQVAKVLNETARRTRILALKGGLLDGRPIDADQVRDLASLPPADVLRAQTLGAIVGPLDAIAAIFAAPLREFAAVIDARIAQLGEQGEGVEPAAEAAPAPAEVPEAPGAETPADEPTATAEPAEGEAEGNETPTEANEEE